MDYKYTYYSKYNESTYSYDTESITTLGVKASTDHGIGLMVGENSIGYVADLSVDTRNALSFDPIKDLMIEHKAGTLNGEYYDSVQLLDAVIEVCCFPGHRIVIITIHN